MFFLSVSFSSCREFVLVSTGTSEYTLTKEDVGRQLAFVYIPINFEGWSIALSFVETIETWLYIAYRFSNLVLGCFSGQEGESVSAVSPTVRQGTFV